MTRDEAEEVQRELRAGGFTVEVVDCFGDTNQGGLEGVFGVRVPGSGSGVVWTAICEGAEAPDDWMNALGYKDYGLKDY